MMLQNRVANEVEHPLIIDLWERSVSQTHSFLTQEDQAFFKEHLPNYLNEVDVLLWKDGKDIIGFSGVTNDNLDMLFLDPDFIGKQYGSHILNWLVANKGVTRLDVNEQNEKAKEFYLQHGFVVASRSDTDGFGKNYPILHLVKQD
ncbi:MAG: GNAT family N-acetyltransferase [Vagococcus sp.]